jgi:threonine 3-dehydrogenase
MKALIKERSAPGLRLCDVEEPHVGSGDVLIKVHRAGICGTDLHIHDWDAWAQRAIRPPLVLGHEFVGEIVGVGADGGGLAIGDLVSGEGHIVCGRCRNCRAGRRHLCADVSGVGVDRDGAFAELVSIPTTNVWRHQPGMDEDIAAIFDPFGNAVHSALSFPVLGEDVLITGAGPIGAMAVAVVRHAGARHVVVTDTNAFRLDIARRMGATLAINPREHDLADVRSQLGMEEGFDVGLEMSGAPDALAGMVASMAHGGSIAMLGIPTRAFPLDWTEVVFNMLTIKGIYGREMYETWYAMTTMVQLGLDIRPVITHRFAFDRYEEAFAAAASGQAGKVLLDWETA